MRYRIGFLLAATALGAPGVGRSAHAEPRHDAEVIVAIAGERPDATRMERAVETLLSLGGVAVAWERLPAPPQTPLDAATATTVAPGPGTAPRRAFIDLRDPRFVTLRVLSAAPGAPADRTIFAPSLDEATCEAIAQILRSVLLAPGPPPSPKPPPPAATVSQAPPSLALPLSPLPHPRFELRSGYVATHAAGGMSALTGPTLAASWATGRGASSPTVVLSVTRTTGVFAGTTAPADASVQLWSARAGLGWERSWQGRWRLAIEATVGPDWTHVVPLANGQTGAFLLSPPQDKAHLAVRAALRGERAVIGPVLVFLEAQVNAMPRTQLDVGDGGATRTTVIQDRVAAGGAVGLGVRY